MFVIVCIFGGVAGGGAGVFFWGEEVVCVLCGVLFLPCTDSSSGTEVDKD